jgi:hypothetical protein
MPGPNEFAPDSYWQALKDRASELAGRPLQTIRGVGQQAMAGLQRVMPTDPNLRPGVPPEALPGNIDPNSPEFQQRQAIARALAMQQQQGQPMPPPMPPQAPPPMPPQPQPQSIQF